MWCEEFITRRMCSILDAHKGFITSRKDLLANKEPTLFFYLMAMHYRRKLEPVDDTQLQKQMKWRKFIHPLFRAVLPDVMGAKQTFEYIDLTGENKEFQVPDTPVIWMANHGFKDDISATLNAARRHSYILFASLPHMYNTLDGITADLNGTVVINRKVKASRSETVSRCSQVLKNGTDLIMFPEGVWNKSPNQLVLNLWPGIYHISMESGASVIPVAHYIEDVTYQKKDNRIHTLISAPISVAGMTEEEALEYLRNTLATMRYILMERYGRTTREEALGGCRTSSEAWEKHLRALSATAPWYDREIELCADYRPRSIVYPMDVWQKISQISSPTVRNARAYAYAWRTVEFEKRNNFQRRF